jgi:hypothetical protein
LSYITETTEKTIDSVNGGYSDFDYIDNGFYISDFDLYNNYLNNLNDTLSIGAYPVEIEPTNFGV